MRYVIVTNCQPSYFDSMSAANAAAQRIFETSGVIVGIESCN